MPLLKRFLATATGEKEARLRGKAFECMSLLGMAVGNEKFKPDADEALRQMMATNVVVDELLREYIKEASERICEVMKRDFAPYLPFVLPGIFESLKVEKDIETAPPGTNIADEEEDEEYLKIQTGEGKMVKVKTSKLDEMTQALQLLDTYCTQLEGAYFDFVQDTARVILPLLQSSDVVVEIFLQSNDEVRSAAFACWAKLIKSSRQGAKERNIPDSMSQELLKEFLAKVYTSMEGDSDCDSLGAAAEGIALCIRAAGPHKFSQQECHELLKKMFEYIERSFERERKDKARAAKKMKEHDVSDDEGMDDDEEQSCRRLLEEVIGALMETSPDTVLPCLPDVSAKVQQWLSPGGDSDRLVAGDLSCHIIQYLKAAGKPAWPAFLPTMIDGMLSKEAEERLQGAWIINLGAEIPEFSEYAHGAYQKLGQWLSLKKAPKKKDNRGRAALDNAVAALLRLAVYQPVSCPPGLDAWGVVLSKLPLREDEEEAKKVHKMVTDLVLQEHKGILGQENANLGKLLSILAEVYKNESICEQECDAQIANIFRKLPREVLVQLASNFNEKQQAKIQNIVETSTAGFQQAITVSSSGGYPQ
eukprot:gnl/MRDRNA2_/MRDRNA2_70559_c0_seq1.p1 gnl/MRDRNA2_/MRDRNA2_70559_c0~~gnl/MRDRNA2_/MRDRNA2_70559_c0_seq1.p1  ORF type:complete len:693 (+),score=186.49 gnl/MRDRNA2_/MRDRNA2_70559_c0_seq1:307-2079(+)